MNKDYSEFVVGSVVINHQERVKLGLTNDEYIIYELSTRFKIQELTYKDFWINTGFYPSEIRKILCQLKKKKFDLLNHKIVVRSIKKGKANKISFQDSEIFNKKLFAEKFKDWNKDKLTFYWNAADSWSEEGNKKVNWYKTILNWASRDEKLGKLKFVEKEKQGEINFFANR